MIFDKEYDTSLWYMIKSDRKNRKAIINFIKEIPEDLLDRIQVALSKVKKGQLDYDSFNDEICMCKSEKDPNIEYYFDIDDIDMSLTLSKEFNDGKMGQQLFEIVLYPFDLEEAKRLEYYEEEPLGTIATDFETLKINDYTQEVTCYETKYSLHNSPIGHFVSHTHEILNGKREVQLFKRVSLNRAPKDLNRNSLLIRKLKSHN